MTRETKLGIGVSTALLVLVIMAVARALLGGGDSSTVDPAAKIAQANSEPPAPGGPPGPPGGPALPPATGNGDNASLPPGILPAGLKEMAPLPAGAARPGEQGTAEPPGLPLPSAASEVPLPGAPAVPEPGSAVPLPEPPVAEAVPSPGFPGTDRRSVNVAQNSQRPDDKEAQRLKALADAARQQPLPPSPTPGIPLPPGPPDLGPRARPDAAGPKAAAPTTEELLKEEKARADRKGPPAPLPSPAEVAGPISKPLVGPEPPVSPPTVVGSVIEPKKAAGPPMPAPPDNPVVQGPPASGVPQLPTPSAVGIASLPNGPAAPVPSAASAGEVVPPGRQIPVPMGPQQGAPPPPAFAMAGNSPGGPLASQAVASEAGGPPIRVPAPAPDTTTGRQTPLVRDYVTQAFRCTDQVRTFAAISQQFYHNEKYAAALLRYNRDYPNAVGLDGARDSATLLALNQKVLLPPLAILEDRYPAEVRDYRPVAAAPPVEIARAQPVATTPLTQPLASGASPAGPEYRVSANGEMLYEIARQRLGDGKRWPEIYRLNPSIQPQLPIPGGTVVQLPPGARVGP